MAAPSVTTVEKFIETFLVPTLTKIVGQPTYENIKELNEEINVNEASIVTAQGGRAQGHLELTVSPTVYATFSNTPFVQPTMPIVVNPTNLQGPQIAEANQIYAAE